MGKTFSVCILQTEWPNEKVLRQYSKMTPGSMGIWKDMVGVTSIDEADYVAIIDYTVQDIKNKPAVYLSAHPPHHPGYRCFDDAKNAIAKFDLKDTFGFGEWWLDYSYDYLSTMMAPKKPVKLCAILSGECWTVSHQRRLAFMEKFCKDYRKHIDIYGRVRPEQIPSMGESYLGVLGVVPGHPAHSDSHSSGKDVGLLPYRYVLEFDECGCPNYFSERVFDDLLLWCMPIYSGGTELHKYLPENSFRYLDVLNTPPSEVVDIVNSDFREKHIEDMREARDLLLNKYQLWPRVYDSIRRYL